MHALRQDILSPSGVEFATCLKLTPSTVNAKPDGQKALTMFNLVVARSNLLRIFEVREVPTLRSSHLDDERERRGNVRKGTEPVEGEVEMDEQGEGYVNMGAVKVIWIAHSCPLHRAIQLFCPPSEPKTSSELTLIALLFVSSVNGIQWGCASLNCSPLLLCARLSSSWNCHRTREYTHHVFVRR